jgi:chromosome segregation ATPase
VNLTALTRPLALAASLVAVAGGCGLPVVSRWAPPTPQSEWRAARTSATQAAQAGRYATADSTLAAFARRRPDTDEAREALYWRALLRLDPANREAAPREAVQLFDLYLSDSVAPRALEAALLRRAAADADSLTRQMTALRTAIDAATSRAEGAASTARAEQRTDRGREQELQRLRDELAGMRAELTETRAELDRIKRRVATPRP